MQVVDDFQAFEAGEEGIVVLAGGLHPLHFGKGGHAWQHLVFCLLLGSDVFGPQIGLHAEDVAGFIGREVGSHGLESIDFLHGLAASDGERLVPRLIGLIVVEVHWFVGCHDDIVTLLGSLCAGLCSTPRHDGGSGVDITAEQFVPTDEALAL